jgi:hypothetical protein
MFSIHQKYFVVKYIKILILKFFIIQIFFLVHVVMNMLVIVVYYVEMFIKLVGLYVIIRKLLEVLVMIIYQNINVKMDYNVLKNIIICVKIQILFLQWFIIEILNKL